MSGGCQTKAPGTDVRHLGDRHQPRAIDLFEGDGTRKTPVMLVAHESRKADAILAVTTVTIHEFLARPTARWGIPSDATGLRSSRSSSSLHFPLLADTSDSGPELAMLHASRTTSRREPVEHVPPEWVALGKLRVIEVVTLVVRHADVFHHGARALVDGHGE